MTNNFKKIEKELTEKTKEFGFDIEEIFNIGVKFGRELEANNMENYRLQFFIEREELANLAESIRKKHETISNLIANQVKEAIKETINEETSWTVGVGSYYKNDGKFSEEISNKYNVQLVNVTQPQTDGDFEVEFSVTGKIAEIFNQFEYRHFIEITLSNDSGEDNTTLSREKDINKLYNPSLLIYPSKTKEELDRLKDFEQALVKKLMFQIIGRS
jgi:hypothetical protein